VETDDLNAPLGQTAKKAKSKLTAAMPKLLAGLLSLFGLVIVGWAALVNDPLGGEPMAVVATKTAGAGMAATDGLKGDGKEHSRHDGPAGQAAEAIAAKIAPPSGSQTVTIIDGSSGKSKEVVIPGMTAGSGKPNGKMGEQHDAAAVSRGASKLLQKTRHGFIPKIATDGTRASAYYAHPRLLPANRKDAPRIAVIIGGIGISASGTADAFSMLPPAVTFALAPYSADVEKLAERARAERHEVLLQTPMEPFDYPDNDPGPQTLLTSLTPEQNIDRLHWLMSRFKGYVGIDSFMGARFTATQPALTPVLQETAKRGLIFVDASVSNRSVASQVAGSKGLPFAKADMVLDAVPTPIEIDRALTRLELMARESGTAVGLATAQPGTVARIADWAKKVESRGFVLVPITMVAVKAKSS
jgi:polysaccharide deacetylase 2 family uncharacterized protein YibQ